MKELVDDIKMDVSSRIRVEITELIQGMVTDALLDADIPKLIRNQIQTATKDIEVINAVIKDRVVEQARVITPARESAEVKESLSLLRTRMNELIQGLSGYNYDEHIKKAITSAMEDVHIKNAVIHNEDVVNAVIHKEEHTVPVIKEKVEIRHIPYDVRVPNFREEFIKVKKVIFPDGREAV